MLIGFGFLHVRASVLIALLLIISRMSGPVGQIQQGLQQVAFALPAYDKVVELKRELAAVGEGAAPGADAPFPEGPVVFEQVSFRHPSASGEAGRRARRRAHRPGAGAGRLPRRGRRFGGRQDHPRRPAGRPHPAAGRGGSRWAASRCRARCWPAGAKASATSRRIRSCSTTPCGATWRGRALAQPRPTCGAALALADADALVRRMDNGLDSIVGRARRPGLRRRAAADRPGARRPAAPAPAGARRGHQRDRRSHRAPADRAARARWRRRRPS